MKKIRFVYNIFSWFENVSSIKAVHKKSVFSGQIATGDIAAFGKLSQPGQMTIHYATRHFGKRINHCEMN